MGAEVPVPSVPNFWRIPCRSLHRNMPVRHEPMGKRTGANQQYRPKGEYPKYYFLHLAQMFLLQR